MRLSILFVFCSTALAIPVQMTNAGVADTRVAIRDTTSVTGILESIYEDMTDADGTLLLTARDHNVARAWTDIVRRNAMPDPDTSLECDFPVTLQEIELCEQSTTDSRRRRDAMPAAAAAAASSVEDAVTQAAEKLVQGLDGN